MTDPNPITRVRVAHGHTAGHATIIAAMSPLGAVCKVTNLDDSARDWINRPLIPTESNPPKPSYMKGGCESFRPFQCG